MTKSSAFAKGVLAAAAGLAALGCAAAAQAQPYGPGYSNYDPCRRDAGNRGIVGALVGGGIGATVGSQVAANHHRSDGSLVGGIVGAIAGASIGNSTAACKDLPPPPPPPMREAPPPPPSAYNDLPPPADYYGPPPARYAERETVWVYGRHGMRFRVMEDRVDRDGCTMAESPIYMPDGRVDRRFVRVCPDYRGRYHVVD